MVNVVVSSTPMDSAEKTEISKDSAATPNDDRSEQQPSKTDEASCSATSDSRSRAPDSDNREENTGDNDTKKDDLLLPNDQNGSDMVDYTFGQTLNEIDIHVTLPRGIRVRGKDVIVEIASKHLRVGLKGLEAMIIDGEIHGKIKPNLCFWNLEDNNTIFINLEKANKLEWWPRLMLTEPRIDTSRVNPGQNLDDLDDDTRDAVKRISHDQRQRQLGLPTSDEQQQAEMLENIRRQNPTMNLDNVMVVPDNC